MIMFISGGARSGKSSFAEKTAKAWHHSADNTRLCYIATAKISDGEMARRIAIHREGRTKDWHLYEELYDITAILTHSQKGDVLLLDCLTIWLSNAMFELEYNAAQILESVLKWLKLAKERELQLLIVSNDVNEGIPSSYKLVNEYIYQLELLHQFIIREADAAVQVVAGIPDYWKGEGS